MPFLADLHVHSPYAIATSKDMVPVSMARYAQLKGLAVVATGDFTHPAWFQRLREELVPAEAGLFRLREDLVEESNRNVPISCRSEVRFMLSAETSNIYKRAGKTRKVHNLLYVSSFEEALAIREAIEALGGNARSDGRPILKIDSEDMLGILMKHSPEGFLVPAHLWTPHFSVLGAFNQFNSLEECYGDLAEHVFAVETGLSSDPPMNWRLSQLDRLTLVSNSDAHSPRKLGREANVFHTDLSFAAIRDAIKGGREKGFGGTIEFYPQEGKYHLDGHRACGRRMTPEETRRHEGRCPDCGKKVTVGVVHRVEELADRKKARKPKRAAGFTSLIGLPEVLGELLEVRPTTKKVEKEYTRLIAALGSELHILREAKLDSIAQEGWTRLGEAIGQMREGDVHVSAGYDGEYGTVKVFA